MTQKDKSQYKMNVKAMTNGNVKVGYEATTGNDTPSNTRSGNKKDSKI